MPTMWTGLSRRPVWTDPCSILRMPLDISQRASRIRESHPRPSGQHPPRTTPRKSTRSHRNGLLQTTYGPQRARAHAMHGIPRSTEVRTLSQRDKCAPSPKREGVFLFGSRFQRPLISDYQSPVQPRFSSREYTGSGCDPEYRLAFHTSHNRPRNCTVPQAGIE